MHPNLQYTCLDFLSAGFAVDLLLGGSVYQPVRLLASACIALRTLQCSSVLWLNSHLSVLPYLCLLRH